MDGDGVRARAAAANNADLYEAVFAAQGRRFCRDAALFRAIDPPPPCYSSVTTLDPGATAEQLAAIDALQAEGRADVGVKDGFCRLDRDLAARGLAVLFEASWLWAPAAFEAAAGPAGWERVTTPLGLTAWEAAWAAAGSPTETRVFPAALLANPAIAIFGRRGGSGYDAGCIGNRSAGCIGLSNIFAPAADRDVFAAAAVLVASLAPGVPLVGYHRGAPLAAMLRIGFREVGRLRVWIAPA